MNSKEIKLNVEYRYKNEILTVTRRINNKVIEKWYMGFGGKYQKIKHNKKSFLLSNGIECLSKELEKL